ncbi:hypothetical protein SS50377_24887 [Spironucleus salmonicida]|uniref:Uncharacterized protein n=1 Tax=Spironucleus salmonicida TaxID=348837 RepID=V6LF27_9EUKA|nr:hypothetical protein SS50377_24887 [Spironucleus salmonicida]|eukprot:EST43140.1 Hypothetical protein SS50377_17197 [Spironucleus salmonicida]
MSKKVSKLTFLESSEWSQTFSAITEMIDVSLSENSEITPRSSIFDLHHELEQIRLRITRISQSMKQFRSEYIKIRELQMRQEDQLIV